MPIESIDHLSKQLIPVVLLITATLLTMPLSSHADDYLKELEAEAKSLDDPAANAGEEEKSNWSPSGQGIAETLSPNLNRSGFEENLKYNFIGSFTFYSRLSESSKEKVYAAYQERNDLNEITSLIKKLVK